VETSRAREVELDDKEVLDSREVFSGGFGGVSFGGGEGVLCATYVDRKGDGGGERLGIVPTADIRSELQDWKKEVFVGDTGERS